MTNELTDDELREAIVRHEWDQFQRTNNEGGRAACQGNWPVFHQMRLAQFLTWERPLLTSYAADLDAADHVGRNLLTEKYGRMMASTAPENFTKNIEPYIPRLSEERAARQEQVIAQQVAWAKDFRERYPKLGEAMRALTTTEDTPSATSFETYLRGELGTYSDQTFERYEAMIGERAAASPPTQPARQAPFTSAHRQNYSENRPQNASVISVARVPSATITHMTRRTPTISARQYQTRSISQANSTTNSMVAIRSTTHPTANSRG